MTTKTVSRATLVTGPVSEPVTLTQAKKQLEIPASDTAHDDHITLLIQAAREQWEHDTDSAVIEQTWLVNAECFYDDELYLPKRPIQSITSVKYYDSTNTQQTLSSSVYQLDAANRAVRLAYLQNWPLTVERFDSIEIKYVCGYDDATAVPAVAKQAILLLIGHYFENRDMIGNAMSEVVAYENLVKRFMRPTYP